MATVPTLTVGSTDQTSFIQDKTLGWKLKTLDFTLIDPVSTPLLHNAVSVDEPEWHGRVSTVESYPFKSANGDDHRYVKVTATNKHVAASDTAPFDLSDTPNYSTTFPFKDLVVIRTLADQTDLSTAELRVQGTIYEPGLLPGMTIGITCAAESMTAEPVIVTEMTVSWLDSTNPEFHLEFSDTGVPPVTLGGLIDSGACDCAPFECIPPDLTVYTTEDESFLACTVAEFAGDCQSSTDPTATMHLYNGASYKVEYLVYHNPNSLDMQANLLASGSPNFVGGLGAVRVPMGSGLFGTAIPAATVFFDMEGDCDVHAWLDGDTPGGPPSDNSFCEISAKITYVGGPDPRFMDVDILHPCQDPHSGQLVLDGTFTGDGTTTDYTTSYPYGSQTLEVFVNGLDWTAQMTESQSTAGDYSLSYPPPTGATVRPVYRGA